MVCGEYWCDKVNIRLISGQYGGRVIEGSGTDRTHPMGERIRNAIFNKLNAEIEFEGAKILDAFTALPLKCI